MLEYGHASAAYPYVGPLVGYLYVMGTLPVIAGMTRYVTGVPWRYLRIATRRIYGFGHQDHRLERRGGRKGELGSSIHLPRAMDSITCLWAFCGPAS